MKQLSGSGTPLPSLAARTVKLAPELVSTLDQNNLAHPAARIAETYWAVSEQLSDMLESLNSGSLDRQDQDRRKRRVLGDMELLMHRCSALSDYLGKLMQALLPTALGQKKGRDAGAAKRRLDEHINRFYKIPVNLIKHEGFGLSWIEMRRSDLVIHGYMVTGPIGNGVHGPGKFRRPGRDDPEGYSFALTLREALPAIYKMCEIAEDALVKAAVLMPADESTWGDTDKRIKLLSETLELLNQLPLRGFPDEHQVRVPIFSMQEGAVLSRTSPMRTLPGPIDVHSELRSVRQGGTYKLPYFQGQRHRTGDRH